VAEASPWSQDRGLEALRRQVTTEAEHAVAELLALVVAEEFMSELFLEGGEAAECCTAPLGVEDPHSQDVLAGPLAVGELKVPALAGFGLAVVDAVDALPSATRHEVHVGGDTLYVSAAGAVELEGALGAGASLGGNSLGGNFGGSGAYTLGVHSLHDLSVGRVPGSVHSCGAISLSTATLSHTCILVATYLLVCFNTRKYR
jgi:hypothetical protein